MNSYLVIGFYPDSDQRFADVVEAESIRSAEIKVAERGVAVVATFQPEGAIRIDPEPLVRWPA